MDITKVISGAITMAVVGALYLAITRWTNRGPKEWHDHDLNKRQGKE